MEKVVKNDLKWYANNEYICLKQVCSPVDANMFRLLQLGASVSKMVDDRKGAEDCSLYNTRGQV